MTAALSPKLAAVTRKAAPAGKCWPLANVLPPMDALATAPRALRQHAAAMLDVWELRGFGSLDEDTRTVVSELVTNAVLASSGPDCMPRYIDGRLPVIQFGMFSDRTVLDIEVRDMMPGLPQQQQPGISDEHGRGLALVAELSEQWGTRPDGGGKVVWSRLRVSHGPR